MTADEMFEELGYEIETEDNYYIEYKKKTDNYSIFIVFDIIDKTFGSFCYITNDQHCVTMQELKAINQKCKELGWLGDE